MKILPSGGSLAAVLTAAALAVPGPTAAAAPPEALPRVTIDAPRAIPSRAKLGARMRVTRAGAGGYRGRIGIELRGQSSLRFPKRSYSLETRGKGDRGRDVALLGLPAEDDWILYAAYNDKTLMRNVLALGTARWMGRYASATRFVELVLGGRYRGVYVLMETPELGAGRVPAGKGGFLVELSFDYQARRKGAFFRAPETGRPIVYDDPGRDDLGPRAARRIRSAVGGFERALYDPAFRSARRGWRAHLDEASAVDYVLLAELFKNEDAFHASTYLAGDARGPLRLGPAWDFDISSGNSNYGNSRFLRGWMLEDRPWAERLYRDRRFTAAVAMRWRTLRARGLRGELARAIDAHETALQGAVGRNFRRWPVLGRYVWPNPRDPATGRYRPTYRSEVRHLESWLSRRIAWMDRNVDRLGR